MATTQTRKSTGTKKNMKGAILSARRPRFTEIESLGEFGMSEDGRALFDGETISRGDVKKMVQWGTAYLNYVASHKSGGRKSIKH